MDGDEKWFIIECTLGFKNSIFVNLIILNSHQNNYNRGKPYKHVHMLWKEKRFAYLFPNVPKNAWSK